jgi:hypothetical protein
MIQGWLIQGWLIQTWLIQGGWPVKEALHKRAQRGVHLHGWEVGTNQVESSREETNSKPSHQTSQKAFSNIPQKPSSRPSRKAAPPAPSRWSRVSVCARRAAVPMLPRIHGPPLVAALQSLAVMRYGLDRTAGELPQHSDMQVTEPAGLAGVEAGN